MAVLIALACFLQTDSLAQRKPSRRPAPAPTPMPDMRPEALQVAAQIKNVSNFIYIFGKIVNGLEVAEDQAKRNEAPPAVQAQTKKSKDALVANINGLRAGLGNLSRSFQANPRLQAQYLKLSYATEAAANAERLAAAGRYDEAGKSLVTVIERLTDTIVSMRLL
jgi:hypothetical protein